MHPARNKTSNSTTANPRGTDQAALHRIVVHVIQFLPAFLFVEDVEVIRHQHPTEEQEFQLLAHFLDPLNKTTAKPLGEEEGRPPIGTGGDELQLPRAVSALVEWHTAGEYTFECLAERWSLREVADPQKPGSAPASGNTGRGLARCPRYVGARVCRMAGGRAGDGTT